MYGDGGQGMSRECRGTIKFKNGAALIDYVPFRAEMYVKVSKNLEISGLIVDILIFKIVP